MSYMKMLDEVIVDKVQYDHDTRENEHAYLQLRDEVNECKLVSAHGQLEIEQLSPIAQECVREWESLIEAKAHHDFINYAEQPEDY
jgi:hypothetical protein